jgi:elongation factor G
MNDKAPSDIRTVALIGHQGCGKTSLAEAILLLTGVTHTLGNVNDKTSLLDYEPEEQERGGSLNAAVATCETDGRRIHVVDTPGDGNFIHEARWLLKGVDSAVLVISAVDGVEVETERTWRFATEAGLPRVIFLNKMDRERANPEKVLQEVEEILGVKAVPVQVPIGRESNFKGVVDLLANEARLFKGDQSGAVDLAPVPDDLADEVENALEALTEAGAEGDDELLEKYLETLELTQEEVFKGLGESLREGRVVPVLYGVASENRGVNELLDFTKILPSAMDRPGREDEAGNELASDPTAPFVGRVIKSIIDPYAGTLSVIRVLRGSLGPDTDVKNTTQEGTERLGHLHWVVGKKLFDANSATVGDLVAVAKLKATRTGDTLCDQKAEPVLLPGFEVPPPMSTFVIKPATRRDEDRMRDALARISSEDPAFVIGQDGLTKETTVSGQSQSHIELSLQKLSRKYKVNVTTQIPPVPYRETIRSSIEVEGKHKKQTGGRGQFGVAFLRIEPLPRGGGFEFVNAIRGGSIPRQYIPAVQKGIVGAMERGVIAGYPVQDLKITVYDGKFHAVDSSEAAFMMAGSKGFKAGFSKCNPILLEPIVQMTIVCPEDTVGDVMGDIGGRRGRLQNTDYRGSRAVVSAIVPLAEVQTYSADLRAMTQGKGTFTMELHGYEEVPGNLQEKIIAASVRKAEEDDD